MVAVEGRQVNNLWLEETQRKQREEVTSQAGEAVGHAVKVVYQAVIAKGMEGCLVEGVLQEEGPQVEAST